MTKIEHNYTIDFLRGIASFAVCFFHFAVGNPVYLTKGNPLRQVAEYGYLGVELFFVISGFIIPYTLYINGFKIKRFATFLIKRCIRIEPAYLISLFFAVCLLYVSTLSPLYHGKGFNFSVWNMLSHVGYLTNWVGYEWYNPVYWTLAIEFQYYILIGIVYYFIVHKYLWVRCSIVVLLLGASFLTKDARIVSYYFPMFVAGILIFQHKNGFMNQCLYYTLSILCIVANYYKFGIEVVIAVLIPYLMINFVNLPYKKIFVFMGSISYSIYLIHSPIGGRIINFSMNFITDPYLRSGLVFITFFVSVWCSYLYFKFVESPFLSISKRIRY